MTYRDETITGSDVEHAIVAGTMIGDPKTLAEKLLGVVIPEHAKLEQIDLQAFENKYAMNPRRKTGARSLATAAAFIAYANAHKDGSTALYADKSKVRFEAVFNDHAPGTGAAGHGDFKAAYNCPLSVEWQRWMAKSQHHTESKSGMTQTAFMQFLEDNLLDITQPESAALLSAVRSFETHSEAKFKSATNLDNGSVVFNYTETVNEVPQDGKLSLPSAFEITIPVFEGGDKYVLQARLRYRVSGGGLTLWYELVRPHKTLEHVFNEVRDQIINAVEGVPVYDV